MLSLLPITAAAQGASPPAAMADSAEIRTAIAQMAAEIREGQGFHYRPLLRDGRTMAALVRSDVK